MVVVVVSRKLGDVAMDDLSLRGADATYVAVARRLDCPLVTWDVEMVRKTRGTIVARRLHRR